MGLHHDRINTSVGHLMASLVDPVVDTSETHFHFDRNMDGCMAAKEHDCTEDKDFETMEKEQMLIN